MKKLLFAVVFTFPVMVYAQVPSASPAIVGAINSIGNKIPASLPIWVLGALGIVAELVVRFVPSAKPRSMLLVVSGVLGAISGLFAKLSSLLDQVIQNVKDPEEKK